jgi:DNA-binding beta-propeller fold protein YncE
MRTKHLFRLLRVQLAAFCLAFGVISALAQAGPILVVVNQTDHDISLINPIAGKQFATVDVGGVTGHEAVVSPDGQTVFVPIYGDSGVGRGGTDGDRIVAIDLASRKIVGAVQFPRGVRPHCAVVDPHTGLIAVTTELDQSISLLDPKSMKIVGSIPTGQPQSHMLVLSHDGRFGYTANVGPGTVSVLDMKARKTITVIPISANTQRISISNDDRWVFTADQTAPRLAVIDTRTNQVARWIALPSLGYGTAVTKDGRSLLVALRTSHQVGVVDLQSMEVTHLLDVPTAPTEILIRPDGKFAYVSCPGADAVAVVEVGTWKLIQTIAAGKAADGLAWKP